MTHAAIDMLCALMQVTSHYKTFHELHVLCLFWICEFFCKQNPLILSFSQVEAYKTLMLLIKKDKETGVTKKNCVWAHFHLLYLL